MAVSVAVLRLAGLYVGVAGKRVRVVGVGRGNPGLGRRHRGVGGAGGLGGGGGGGEGAVVGRHHGTVHWGGRLADWKRKQ